MLFANTAIYSPIPYLPQTAAILAGRLAGLPPIALMYLGRLANALAYAVMGVLIIRTLPMLKWPACLALLSPLPIFLAGSLSADPMTIALAFLSLALIMRLSLLPRRASAGELLTLGICLSGVSLCKSIYFPVILLLPAVPLKAWGVGRGRIFKPILIAGASIGVAIIWSRFSTPMLAPLRSHDELSQIRWIESHPIAYLGVMARTLKLQAMTLIWASIGVLGWLDILLSPVFVGAYMLLTLGCVLCDPAEATISRSMRVWALIAVVISAVLVITSPYVIWTPVGQVTIDGIQGRYLLPLALLVFTVLHRRSNWQLPPLLLQAMMLGSCVYTAVAVLFRYYL